MIPCKSSYRSLSFCGPYFIVGKESYSWEKSARNQRLVGDIFKIPREGKNEEQVDYTDENDVVVGDFIDSYENLPTKVWYINIFPCIIQFEENLS